MAKSKADKPTTRTTVMPVEGATVTRIDPNAKSTRPADKRRRFADGDKS